MIGYNANNDIKATFDYTNGLKLNTILKID